MLVANFTNSRQLQPASQQQALSGRRKQEGSSYYCQDHRARDLSEFAMMSPQRTDYCNADEHYLNGDGLFRMWDQLEQLLPVRDCKAHHFAQ